MPQCNDDPVLSQPTQILILRDTPLLVSFLCLSPSHRCHIPSLLFPPPAIIFPPGLSTMRWQLQLCWHPDSARASAGFFCPAASVSLSVSLPCLPALARFCLAVFLSTPLCSALQHPLVSLFPLKPTVPPALPALLLHLVSLSLFAYLFSCFQVSFSCLVFSPTTESFHK